VTSAYSHNRKCDPVNNTHILVETVKLNGGDAYDKGYPEHMKKTIY